ncbi:MAG: radical SAM protein [Candidatus Aminicenantes bacterium]|nr:radical SAM protein [Candidatus Aminicenantes bacterium]
MAEVLKKKEIHVFTKLNQDLAYDVNDMHLFEINRLTKEIFEQVDGKTPEQVVAALANRFPPKDVSDVLGQLIKLNLVGHRLPIRGALEQQGEIPDDGIKRLVLFVSQDCNLNCRYCYTRYTGNIQKKNMSEAVARAAVDLLFREANKVDDLAISFYGGEPMLRFDLIKTIIPYANRKAEELQKNIKYTMTTNGALLTDEAIEFLALNKVNIMVSLDGRREIHDENRVYADGSGSFAKVFPAFTKMKEKADGTRTLSVMHSFDIPMKDIAQSLLDLGSPNFNILPAISGNGQLIIPAGGDVGDGNCDSIDIYNRQFEEMAAYFLDNGMMFREKPPIDFAWIFEKLEKKEKREINCGAAYMKLTVDADGNILPCDHFIGETAFYMGNVLTNLDRSCRETFKQMRAANSETCRACWARSLCGGWCPFYSFNRYHDLKKPVNDQCKLNKNDFEIAMGVYSILKKRKKTMPQNQNKEAHNVHES